MYAAPAPRQRSTAASGARSAAPRPAHGHTPPAVAPRPAADVVGRDDPLAGVLARAVQRRAAAASPVLQRAVIAINAPSDSDIAQKITRNCFTNLTTRKKRGDTAGPDALGAIVPPKLGPTDSLYILGHGSTSEVADLSPEKLGAQIVTWYQATAFTGTIKLVACSSAVKPKSPGATYAAQLNTYFAHNSTGTFKPSAVDGVLGVAWVDEVSGKILAIDDSAYDREEAKGGIEDAFAEPDADTRKRGLQQRFGKPDGYFSNVHTGKSRWWGNAKVRYLTGL
jgi:hypothetical protein